MEEPIPVIASDMNRSLGFARDDGGIGASECPAETGRGTDPIKLELQIGTDRIGNRSESVAG